MELRAVQEPNVPALRKGLSVVAERARGHDEASRSASSRHEPIELTDHVDANLEGLPLLALDQEFLVASAQYQVYATIWASASVLDNASRRA